MSTKRKILCLFAVTLLAGVGTLKAEWSEPFFHGELDHPDELWSANMPALSNGGLIIYYMNDNSEFMIHTLIEAHRDSPDDLFEPYRIISELSDGDPMGGPWATEDGLHLYYYQWSGGECYIKMAERASTEDTWTHVRTFDEIHESGISDSMPSLTDDELTMFYRRAIGGGKYIWKATRPSIEEPFSETVEVSELNDPGHTVDHPSISPDGLTIYFDSLRDHPTRSAYKATRSDHNEPFGNIQLMEFSGPDLGQRACYVSPDGTEVYYYSGPSNGVYVTRWIESSYEAAIRNIEEAIGEKTEAIEVIEAATDKELAALEALQELTAGGEYGDLGLRRWDIFRARIRIILSMLRQRRARAELRKGLRELERALVLLGADPAPQGEAQVESLWPRPVRLRIGR